MPQHQMRVAIVGGGVCGLTCAVALLNEGVDVHVYEAAAKFGEIGAGIGLGLNAIRILTALGVYDDIQERVRQENAAAKSAVSAQPTTGTNGTKTNGSHTDNDDIRGWFQYVSGTPDEEILYEFESGERNAVGVHRATFLDALVQRIEPARTHFCKRCTHLTREGRGVTMHFQDGTSAEADVVLGADGIKSAVRRFVAGTGDEEADPNVKFSRTRCYRLLVPTQKAAAAGVKTDFRAKPTCFVGENKHLITFTIRGGTMINCVAFSSDADSDPDHYPPAATAPVEKVTVEQVLETYDDWGPEARGLLNCAENPTRWTINVVYPPLLPEQWVRGPVAILGDAAHGMLPHLGAGAGQGIEDGYLLGKLLGHPQTKADNIEEVLKAYATVRQPRAQRVWEGSRKAGDIFDLREGREGASFAQMRDLWTYVWSYPLDQALEEAVASLTTTGIFEGP
ncbi:FAD/NAD(P)-binding domain-containing protein [Phanerochaete sordida]|uniref:FAD/NAD(P)-binding domain-containing protein n=1 Tax=Phanerochaete sordida TaxID=48140 RepID=A0A9P3LMA3_9APHY|nr:FAD/NAD(P)-binding domain-containing protein [Phanerochaete sordida]